MRRIESDAAEPSPLRWSSCDQAIPLSQATIARLAELLGPGGPAPELLGGGSCAPAPCALPARALEGLRRALGGDGVLTDERARIACARGMATEDLIRLRSGEPGALPDAVLLPSDHDAVAAALAICSRERIAVVPHGGGTSVVGGIGARSEGLSGSVALATRRLDRLLELDAITQSATLQAGVVGAAAEQLLAGRGFTLGHFPQSFARATIGGFAATRSAGQASSGYGRFDQNVLALRVATPRGELALGRAPRSAAGPDLRELFLGSEGALGVITAVTVALRRAPQRSSYDAYRLPDFQGGLELLRQLAQEGPLPAVVRLSDELESAAEPALSEAGEQAAQGGCLLVLGHCGSAQAVARERAESAAAVARAGGRPLAGVGERWHQGRFAAPHLRDLLLDAGYFAETLESAAFWSALGGERGLYARLRAALVEALTAEGARALVGCHVSHLYRSGASLYFTVLSRLEQRTLERWREAKARAGAAIEQVGGTISHHHGVGSLHRRELAQELGPLGIALLAAAKRELDPEGIMNPGVLI